MASKQLELVLQALQLSHITVHCLCPSRDSLLDLSVFDRGLRGLLYRDFSYSDVFDFLLELVPAGVLLHYTDTFDLDYFFLRIPEQWAPRSETCLLSMGPCRRQSYQAEEMAALMLTNHIPLDLQDQLQAFYATIPELSHVEALEQLILGLCQNLFEQAYHLTRYPAPGANLLPRKWEGQDQAELLLAQVSIEARYKSENALLDSIASGSVNEALDNFRQLNSLLRSHHLEDEQRNLTHLTIILNTLCRKAVERAGVHPLYIDELSTRYAQALYRCHSRQDRLKLQEVLIRDYCLLVQEKAMHNCAPAIRETLAYIQLHYAETLNLRTLARRVQMPKTYLSTRFKQDTGLTLTAYIHQVRLGKALALLRRSSLSITDIALRCGYSDVNYFIRRFKTSFGLSPKQYQKHLRPPGAVRSRAKKARNLKAETGRSA